MEEYCQSKGWDIYRSYVEPGASATDASRHIFQLMISEACVTEPSFPAHLLENAILDHMANRLFTVERVKAILRGVYREIRNVTKSNEGQRNSLIRKVEVVRAKLDRQYEAIETGAIDLALVAERIKELKERRTQLEDSLRELESPLPKTIPLHFFKDESIASFQQTVRELFMGPDREMTKRYLKLFIEKIVINLPRVEIVGKTEAILATLEKKQL
jgi:site-specific DNA recombinase